MTDLHSIPDPRRARARPDPVECLDPLEDVLGDARLTTQEKRAVLASWASDANAVPHIPSLRQLPDGSIVNVGDILRALKALDVPGETDIARKSRALPSTRPFASRYGPHDDDDPPSCPPCAALPPNSGGGAFMCAEPVPA